MLVKGSVRNHIPKAFTLFLGHFNFFSANSISSFSLYIPIQKASVFLLLSLRPDILPKSFRVCKAFEREDFVPSKIKLYHPCIGSF